VTTFRSYAKINLHLQVCGRRPDGYHELRTVFQTIDLCDELEIEVDSEGTEDSVEIEILEGLCPVGPENLAVRAAKEFVSRWPIGGVRIGLRKRIPMGGGLGGGSSNAATVLLGLRELTGTPEDRGDLWPIARGLGADVPYFLVGGTALGFGRGDEVVALPELPETELLLLTPDVHVSTAEVFDQLAADRQVLHDGALPPTIATLLISGRTPTWGDLVGWNDLQGPVLERYPEVREACDNLQKKVFMGARLSGSGSTLFGRAHPSARERGEESVGSCLCTKVRTLSRETIARTIVLGGPIRR